MEKKLILFVSWGFYVDVSFSIVLLWKGKVMGLWVSEKYSARYCKALTGGTLILLFLSFDVIIIFPWLTVNRI